MRCKLSRVLSNLSCAVAVAPVRDRKTKVVNSNLGMAVVWVKIIMVHFYKKQYFNFSRKEGKS